MHRRSWLLQWGFGACLLVTGLALASCGESRWYPTDPRVEKPDPSRVTVIDTWTVTVGVNVNTATAVAWE